jgi:hypothetical protein
MEELDLNVSTLSKTFESNAWHCRLSVKEPPQVINEEAIQSVRRKNITDQANHPYDFYTLIYGVIHPGLYHTGHIVLLTKILS